MPTPTVHVIVPAHDEAALIGATLCSLLSGLPAGTLQVVVVANGCHDATADIARTFTGVRVVELDTPSKAAALAAGARTGGRLPRVHLDADCAISGADVLRLVQALEEPGVLATAPGRHLQTARSSCWVRGYYRVWERLPGVRDGLYGRGVIALSPEAQRRIDLLPLVLSDDLAISEAFTPTERRVVREAVVTIRAPRTAADLIRRRVRVAAGNRQADRLGLRSPASGTSLRELVAIGRRDARLVPLIPLFLVTALVARGLAWNLTRTAERHGVAPAWLRDDSSRLTDRFAG